MKFSKKLFFYESMRLKINNRTEICIDLSRKQLFSFATFNKKEFLKFADIKKLKHVTNRIY